MKDIYFKPIVTVQLINDRNKVVFDSIFNTFLKRKLPNLLYKMVVTEGSETFNTADVNDQRHDDNALKNYTCLLYTSPSPRDLSTSRMPSSA